MDALINGLGLFLCAYTAWITGLSFTEAIPSRRILQAAAAGLACALIGCILPPASSTASAALTMTAEGVVFLAAAGVSHFVLKRTLRETLQSLFIAWCANEGLAFIHRSAMSCLQYAALILLLVAVLVFLFLLRQLQGAISDFRNEIRHETSEPAEQDALSPPRGWFYLITGGTSLLFLAMLLFVFPQTAAPSLTLSALSLALFWGSLLLLLLIQAYQSKKTLISLEQQYRTEMQSFLNVIRSQRHDYNFHVQTISGLIQQGMLQECRDYVNALEQDSIRMNEVLPLQDPAVAAMIHNFRVLAAGEKIELHLDIQNDLALIATNVYETNKIISNLLQNALDEVSTHRDKSYGIHLTILKRGEYCVIRVSNRVEGTLLTPDSLDRIYQQGYTTKTGHDGVGLSSIRTLAARYHGTIYTRTEGAVIHFIAKIPINYAKQQV